MSLTWNYPAWAINFFQMFHSTYLNIDNATHTVVRDEEKNGLLNAAVHDDYLKKFHTTYKTLALQSGTKLSQIPTVHDQSF